MEVADLVLPVFAIIVTGWLAGWLGYISRSLADGLVHFAYNVAMPALLFVTIAQEPARNLLEWRFLLAFGGGSIRGAGMASPVALVKQIVLNPMVLSTLIGLAWTIVGLPMPASLAAYMNIFAAALTPCALFAIGLSLSVEGIRSNLMASIVLTIVKLIIMPLIVYGLCLASGLNPLYTIAAVICAAVPTAKTVYILAGEYKVEEPLVAATVSITTLVSVVTLMGWLYALASQAG
jgi:predicted permease